jgi:hypothetical protein
MPRTRDERSVLESAAAIRDGKALKLRDVAKRDSAYWVGEHATNESRSNRRPAIRRSQDLKNCGAGNCRERKEGVARAAADRRARQHRSSADRLRSVPFRDTWAREMAAKSPFLLIPERVWNESRPNRYSRICALALGPNPFVDYQIE